MMKILLKALPYRSRRLRAPLILCGLLFTLPAWGADALPVTTASLESLVIYPARTAPASVVSINDSRLSAEVSAVIERIPVKVGQTVEPDALLVELDHTDINLSIREAEATLESLRAQSQQAKKQLKRVRFLADKRSVTEELLGKRETEVKVTAAALTVQQIKLKQLRRERQKTKVRAPFKAIVVERIANVGELGRPGTPLLRVMDATRVEVVAELQPDDVPSLSGSESPVLVARGGRFPVRLERIVPVIDERERSQEVRLGFEGKGALIGTSGHLSWRETSPYLPADLLVRREDRMGVFLLEDGVARFVEFPGAEEGRPALNQLPPESTLILDGRFVVRDGQAVKIRQNSLDGPGDGEDQGGSREADRRPRKQQTD